MKSTLPRASGCTIVLVLCAGRAAFGASPPSFVGLGDLPGGEIASVARAVSYDGSVVVGESAMTEGYVAVRWTRASGLQSLGDLPGSDVSSVARGVSADGTVVIGQGTALGGTRAMRWTAATGMQELVGLPTNLFSGVYGVSADGSAMCGAWSLSTGASVPFRWTASGVTLLSSSPTSRPQQPYAISRDGLTIVGESTNGRAFRWSSITGASPLTSPLGTPIPISAFAVSGDGSVIVGQTAGSSSSHSAPFRWTEQTGVVELVPAFGVARAVSDDGTMIGGMANQGAFLWTGQNGYSDLRELLVNTYHLDLSGWQLSTVTAFSGDGSTIVGWGTHNGAQEGFVVTIPSPATLPSLLAIGSLFSRRRRQTKCQCL